MWPKGSKYCSKNRRNPERIMNMRRDLNENSGPRTDEIEFGRYRLTQDGGLAFPDGKRVQLSARLACILCELAASKGAAVSRLDLMERCWPSEKSSEDNLTRAIADLRKIFRANGGDCIETVYGLGYRLNTGQPDQQDQKVLSFCQEAWHRVYQRQLASLESAEFLFAEAESSGKGYLPARLGIAETQIHRMQLGYSTTMECAPKAGAAIDSALELDPACADALAMKGLLLTWAEWDFVGAEECLREARKRDPNAFIPMQATAWHRLALAKFELADQFFMAASAARHLSMTAWAGRALVHLYRGDARSALRFAQRMVRIDPHGGVSLGMAANIEAAVGDSARAVSMAKQGFEALPDSPVAGAILAYTLAREGLREEARTLLDSQTGNGVVIGLYTLASLAWLELGEPRSAYAALESGFATRCTWLLPMLHDPRLESLNCESMKKTITGSR